MLIKLFSFFLSLRITIQVLFIVQNLSYGGIYKTNYFLKIFIFIQNITLYLDSSTFLFFTMCCLPRYRFNTNKHFIVGTLTQDIIFSMGYISCLLFYFYYQREFYEISSTKHITPQNSIYLLSIELLFFWIIGQYFRNRLTLQSLIFQERALVENF